MESIHRLDAGYSVRQEIRGYFGQGEGMLHSDGVEDGKEKRARIREKFMAAPTLAVTTDEIKALDMSGGIMKSLIGWAERKRILGNHRNDDTGWEAIAITRTSVRDIVRHHAGDTKIAALAIAPALIKTGIYLETRVRNQRGQISHIFAGKARIDADEYIVGFTITEDSNGRRYYNHELTEINKALGGSGQTEEAPVLTSTPAVREPISKIVRKWLFVK